MTSKEKAFLDAAKALAADDTINSGLRLDAIYAIENYINPTRDNNKTVDGYITGLYN